jgi:hypothetical protein
MEASLIRHTATEPKQEELILDALKRALAEPNEQRLFRSGKLPGLFPSRTGISSEAALRTLTDELLETVRTETKGKLIVEWVRITPRGVRFVHERDSAKAVLRELREVIGQTRAGVPLWMQDARDVAQALSERFERQGQEFLARLDSLTERVEVALRRIESAGPKVSDPLSERVPWAMEALEYLDDRLAAGAVSPCPIPELFHALRSGQPNLDLASYQNGLIRLDDAGAVRLVSDNGLSDPEFAILHGHQLCHAIER